MRLPEKPPNWLEYFQDPTKLAKIVGKMSDANVRDFLGRVSDKYLHWDKFRFEAMPKGLSTNEAWVLVQLGRSQPQELPITFEDSKHLQFLLPPKHQEWLQFIDREASWSGAIITRSVPRDHTRYAVNSLMEEAIASSQLEGAVTTRKRAKELLRSGRKPVTEADRMVVNNYSAMLEIRDLKDENLTKEMICGIHKILVKDMMEASDEGRLRTDEDDVAVWDVRTDERIFVPPPASEVQWRLDEVCKFANTPTKTFVHPLIKAIAIHFAIGYIHPYCDGNGRAARAIFYWFLLKNGYDAFEFLPISRIYVSGPSKYARAYLYTETDRGDLTYFIHYNLQVIVRAIHDLHAYLKSQAAFLREAVELADSHPELNYRQLELIKNALHLPDEAFTTKSHAGKFRITFPTARADLLGLERAGLLTAVQRGRTTFFKPAGDLYDKLKEAKKASIPFKESAKRSDIKTVSKKKQLTKTEPVPDLFSGQDEQDDA